MGSHILIPSGVLGLGFDEDALWRGVALVIGTCGTAGADPHVDWMYQITLELAEELGQRLRIARLYSEKPAVDVVQALEAGKASPLAPAPDLTPEKLHEMAHIVALAGAEHIQEALNNGADIVLAKPTTDTAIIAALPLARGAHPGACWHGAKIGECGALCSTKPTSGVILIDFDQTGFEVTPLATGARCTPHSVCAHMLYENSDPHILYEPGGHLDVTEARYTALSDTSVRLEGARWTPEPYTVKLEAARVAGYQTTLTATLRKRGYVENARL